VTPPRLYWDGKDGDTVALFASGAGLHCRAPWIETMANGLAARGIHVARFDFPYMQGRADETATRRPPDPMPKLLDAMRAAAGAARRPGVRFALLGKSMGGRVATMLADELQADAVVVFGYPFHPPRKPLELRTAHLGELRTPCLVLQGERDPFGTREDVRGYRLSTNIRVEWFEGGDHSLCPNARSGFTEQQHLSRALDLAAAFSKGV
jgi:predicted alpha/beta-hydrolase family hydrolase